MKSEIADIFYNLHVTAFDPYEWRIKNFPRIASVFMEPIMYKHLTGKLICKLNNHLFWIALFQPFSLIVSVELEAKKIEAADIFVA